MILVAGTYAGASVAQSYASLLVRSLSFFEFILFAVWILLSKGAVSMEQFKIYNDNHFFAATDQSCKHIWHLAQRYGVSMLGLFSHMMWNVWPVSSQQGFLSMNTFGRCLMSAVLLASQRNIETFDTFDSRLRPWLFEISKLLCFFRQGMVVEVARKEGDHLGREIFLFNVFVGSFAGISLALCFALDEIHDDHRWRLARRQKDGCLHFTHAVSLFPVSEYLSQSDRQKTSTGVLVRDRQWDSPGHDACCAPVACVEGLISEKTAKTLVFRIPAFLFLLCLKWPFCSHMIKMCIISSHRTMLLLFDKDSRRMPSNAIGRRFRGAHFSMQDAQICIILEQRWAQDSRWLLIWPARQVRAFSAIQPEADRNWTQLGPFGFGLFPSDSSPTFTLCATPTFWTQAFKAAYEAHVAERAKEGIPPLALDASQVRWIKSERWLWK